LLKDRLFLFRNRSREVASLRWVCVESDEVVRVEGGGLDDVDVGKECVGIFVESETKGV
jgi:hypothetical protein